ncbi:MULTISPECIES: hypothetical protein [Aerosakkonema]|uniref:hypothetical protein n=1 Tax=Aerosakkonema TaxID=1246629 RepID=UPI0035B7C5F6
MLLEQVFFLAQSSTPSDKNQLLLGIPIEVGIIILVLSLGIMALIGALIPQEIRQRIPIIAMLSGLLGYLLISWGLSAAKSPWFISIFPGIIATILVAIVVSDLVKLDFIWGFLVGICSFILVGLIAYISVEEEWGELTNLATFAVVSILLIADTAALIYWSFIKVKMVNNNFDKVQVFLTMIGTAWIGVALGLMVSILIGSSKS